MTFVHYVRYTRPRLGPRPPQPAPGTRVFAVVEGDGEHGDLGRTWVDTYVVGKDGFAPRSFMKRVDGRRVFDALTYPNECWFESAEDAEAWRQRYAAE